MMSGLAPIFSLSCNRCVSPFRTGVNVIHLRASKCATMSSKKCFEGSVRTYSQWIHREFRTTPKCTTSKYRAVLAAQQTIHQQIACLSRLGNLHNQPHVSSKGSKPPREWIQPEGYDTGIVVFNTLTQRKEPLILPQGRIASW